MYNKVEICGVNTSRLKVLTEAENALCFRRSATEHRRNASRPAKR